MLQEVSRRALQLKYNIDETVLLIMREPLLIIIRRKGRPTVCVPPGFLGTSVRVTEMLSAVRGI